jgi:hypothetical protein
LIHDLRESSVYYDGVRPPVVRLMDKFYFLEERIVTFTGLILRISSVLMRLSYSQPKCSFSKPLGKEEVA